MIYMFCNVLVYEGDMMSLKFDNKESWVNMSKALTMMAVETSCDETSVAILRKWKRSRN